MDATSKTFMTPVQQQISEETDAEPDYSYSSKTKALIITSVALLAIGLVGLAVYVSFPPLLFTGAILGSTFLMGMLLSLFVSSFGIAGGAATACKTAENHTQEIAEREFAFAKASENFDVQVKYYSKAAQAGSKEAIKWEYTTGKNLMLEALNETDEKEKTLKFENGLKIFESSAEHTCYNSGPVGKNYLNTHSELRNKLKRKLNDSNTFEASVMLFWNHVVDKTGGRALWKPPIF